MTKESKHRVYLGMIGASTPVLANLFIVDIENVFKSLTMAAFLGFAVKFLILIYLGGLLAYMHKTEKSDLKLFQIGVAAPAFCLSIANGLHARTQVQTQEFLLRSTKPASVHLVSPRGHVELAAYVNRAQGQTGSLKPRTYSPPKETYKQQFVRGLLGTPSNSDQVWHVVVGSRKTLAEAQAYARELQVRFQGWTIEVFEPYESESYGIVIGANLNLDAALRLKEQAVQAGFPKDAYLKRGPAR